MELRHLRYFVAVAEQLHFTRAAARLHIAQPPLSQQIHQLEDELGVILFYRNKHSVRLTDAGRVVLEEARRTLIQANRVAVVARRASEGLTGNLRVGFSSSVPHTMLPGILRAFRLRFPEVHLALHERSTEEQIESLTAGTIDVGFVRLPLEFAPATLMVKPIFREPLILAIPKRHPLQRLSVVPVSALANEPIVLFPRHAAPGLYDQINGLCRHAGFKPLVAQEALQVHTIISLVSAGLGVAIVPKSIRNLHRAQVWYRTLKGPRMMTEMAIAYEKQNDSIVLRSFLSVAPNEIASYLAPSKR
jgi:DNA-binding transcriptional LysR family regulator